MKNIILSALCLFVMLLFTQRVNATFIPETCPAADVITQAGFLSVQKDEAHHVYTASRAEAYGMPYNLGFVMAIPYEQAVSEEDALNKANAALLTLSGNPLPQSIDKQWMCVYSNDYGYISTAVALLN